VGDTTAALEFIATQPHSNPKNFEATMDRRLDYQLSTSVPTEMMIKRGKSKSNQSSIKHQASSINQNNNNHEMKLRLVIYQRLTR
jgi:hypothetical protein